MRSPSESQRRAVIFDMDGLLLDTERVALTVFHEICAHFDIGDQTALFMQLVGTNSSHQESIMRQSFQDIMNHQTFTAAWTERYTETINGNAIPVKDGVEELLSYLSTHRVRCAVATSTHSEMAAHKLGRAGLLSHFEFIVGGEHVSKGKPDPEPYLIGASRLGVAPANCIALEDSENGVRSAVAAGMTVFQVPDLVPPSEDLILLEHQIFANMREVRDHFETSEWWS